MTSRKRFLTLLAGFCLANSRMVLKDANLYEAGKSRINYFHGCVLMVLMSFGGSTIAAVMCGKPVPFVCNEALVSVCLICWTVAYLDNEHLKGMVNKLLSENDIGAVLSQGKDDGLGRLDVGVAGADVAYEGRAAFGFTAGERLG